MVGPPLLAGSDEQDQQKEKQQLQRPGAPQPLAAVQHGLAVSGCTKHLRAAAAHKKDHRREAGGLSINYNAGGWFTAGGC
ncbi:hypothetical protein GCM10028821_11770 [Hymenobacter jeollabukensis]